MDMIERVARALCEDGGFNAEEMMPNGGARWRYYTTLAITAIKAMREPTEGMLDSAVTDIENSRDFVRKFRGSYYTRMITAALGERA